MAIVLLGAGGQLGQELLQTLPAPVISASRASINLERLDTIAPALDALRPSAVVNCAAYNLVDRAEAEPEQAMAINAQAVRALAAWCGTHACPLVHFSTDYVFGADSRRATPYAENDAPGPLNVYGASKVAGEQHVRALCPQHLIIRTCGMYGHRGHGGKGTNFVQAILRKATLGAPLRVVDDQRCTPTAAVDLARAVPLLLAAGRWGLYHYTNAGSCTWFEFAQAILARIGSHAEITRVTSGDYGSPARRPQYSVLDCTAFDVLHLAPRRLWQDALSEYLSR
jgi:dTDP-4-dehydrorhamnose reductase